MKHLVFWIAPYAKLGEKIADLLAAEKGRIEAKIFPDGERYLRILSDVRDRDVVLVGGTIDDRATLDIFDLGCAIAAYGARSFKVLMPFYGYSTMERAIRPGEVVTAKTRARILSAIPLSANGNQIVFLDLHSDGIPFYFEGPVKTRHLYAKTVVLQAVRDLGGATFTLGSVDAGRAKWVESLANDLGVPAGFVYKRRDSNGGVSIAGVNVSVEGQDVVIYDDMIRSGSSLIQAAHAYKAAGARRITAVATHGLFTQGALERIKSSGIFEAVVCTDSHPAALAINDPLVRVVSTAEIFAQAIERNGHV